MKIEITASKSSAGRPSRVDVVLDSHEDSFNPETIRNVKETIRKIFASESTSTPDTLESKAVEEYYPGFIFEVTFIKNGLKAKTVAANHEESAQNKIKANFPDAQIVNIKIISAVDLL
jgi:hypothetical protein